MTFNINQDDISSFHTLIGKNVKILRERHNLTQIQLSLEIGQNSTSIISQAELGKGKHFNLTHLYMISKVVECNICDFFDENLKYR